MKHSWKIWLLLLPAVILLLLVMATDIAFYRIPLIVNLFRIEREIVIGVLFLTLLPLIRHFFSRFSWTPQRSLILHAALMIGLELVLFLPQVFLKKYLNLWDDNPFLAEYPFIWIPVSMLIAVFFIIGLLTGLLNLNKLSCYRRRGNSDFVHFLLIGSFLLAVVLFNLTEVRHSYQAMTILNAKLRPLLWPIVGFYSTVFLLNVWNMQWVSALSHRNKIIASLIGLPIIGSGILVYFSHLLTPVYAFSVSVKGFALAALAYFVFFSVAAEVVLLLNLPGARRYDRLAYQMTSISAMGRMVQTGCDLPEIADYLLKCVVKITASDYGWIEVTEPVSGQSKFVIAQESPAGIDFSIKNINRLNLSEMLASSGDRVIVNDIYKDSRTLKMRLIRAPWHSLLAMAIKNGARQIGIVYLTKGSSYGYSVEDEQILEPLIVQAGINLAIASGENRPGRIDSDKE